MEELSALQGVSTTLLFQQQSWVCRQVSDGYLYPDYERRPGSTWVVACLVAMLQLLGGFGVVTPGNEAENMLGIFGILIGEAAPPTTTLSSLQHCHLQKLSEAHSRSLSPSLQAPSSSPASRA